MERKNQGKLYRTDDPDLRKIQLSQLKLQEEFNRTSVSDQNRRIPLLQKMFEEFGKGSFVEGDIHANWGGYFCRVGKNVYINFNLTMVDDGPILMEDDVMIGPNVTLISGSHPNDPELRKALWQYTDPIVIHKNAWIGAGAILLPGVEIGENSIIGAGSVVRKSVPADCIAAGNPCRILRKLSEKDRLYYGNHQRIDLDEIEDRSSGSADL